MKNRLLPISMLFSLCAVLLAGMAGANETITTAPDPALRLHSAVVALDLKIQAITTQDNSAEYQQLLKARGAHQQALIAYNEEPGQFHLARVENLEFQLYLAKRKYHRHDPQLHQLRSKRAELLAQIDQLEREQSSAAATAVAATAAVMQAEPPATAVAPVNYNIDELKYMLAQVRGFTTGQAETNSTRHNSHIVPDDLRNIP